jgi:hypothetical protein
MASLADIERYEQQLRDEVIAALASDDIAGGLTHLAERSLVAAYDEFVTDDSTDEFTTDDIDAFVQALEDALELTTPESDPDAVTAWIARSALNAASVATAPTGANLTWRTMRDDAVRDIHTPMDGVTVPAGKPFIVAGTPVMYPGQPVGPPEVWANCRCSVDASVTAAADPPVEQPAEVSDEVEPVGVAVVLTVGNPDAVTIDGGDPAEKMHVTLGYWDGPDASEDVVAALTEWVNEGHLGQPIEVKVTGTAKFGADDPQAGVLVVEHEALNVLRESLEDVAPPDPDHPHFTPHLTQGYGVDPMPPSGSVVLDGIALWRNDEVLAEWKPTAEMLTEDEAFDRADAETRIAMSDAERAAALTAANTRDGPGWLTHPKDTQRLRNYWTKGPGAGKIGWGSEGDLTRCERFLRKYVGPMWSWGTCNNLHHVVFGRFNPESGGRRGSVTSRIGKAENGEAMTATATPTLPPRPREWFENPGLDKPTPLTITADGRVFGHLATWGQCHIGLQGECVEAPKSNHDYAYFRTGEVVTADGSVVTVGAITMDTGHATDGLSATATVSHYDNTGTGVADVAAGEDDIGIWLAGSMRPGVSEQQMYTLKATGAVSGDWRRIGANLELVAALAVNVPGFPIPRTSVSASGGAVQSLVAAAVVVTDPNAHRETVTIATAVVDEMEARAASRARRERATALAASVRRRRFDALASNEVVASVLAADDETV